MPDADRDLVGALLADPRAVIRAGTLRVLRKADAEPFLDAIVGLLDDSEGAVAELAAEIVADDRPDEPRLGAALVRCVATATDPVRLARALAATLAAQPESEGVRDALCTLLGRRDRLGSRPGAVLREASNAARHLPVARALLEWVAAGDPDAASEAMAALRGAPSAPLCANVTETANPVAITVEGQLGLSHDAEHVRQEVCRYPARGHGVRGPGGLPVGGSGESHLPRASEAPVVHA